MQDLAPANTDQSENSSSWMAANGSLIVFQFPRTSTNQFSTDQITLFFNFGHATSCYKGAPQKCFKIIKNSSKSPIFKEIFSYQSQYLTRYGRFDHYEISKKTRIWLENEAGLVSEKLELAMKVGRNVKREFKKMTEGPGSLNHMSHVT